VAGITGGLPLARSVSAFMCALRRRSQTPGWSAGENELARGTIAPPSGRGPGGMSVSSCMLLCTHSFGTAPPFARPHLPRRHLCPGRSTTTCQLSPPHTLGDERRDDGVEGRGDPAAWTQRAPGAYLRMMSRKATASAASNRYCRERIDRIAVLRAGSLVDRGSGAAPRSQHTEQAVGITCRKVCREHVFFRLKVAGTIP
jgi:hypothetical protein